MDSLTITQRIKMITTYYKNGDSDRAIYCALRGDLGSHNRPTKQAIGKIVKKYEGNGVVTNTEMPVYHRLAHSIPRRALYYVTQCDPLQTSNETVVSEVSNLAKLLSDYLLKSLKLIHSRQNLFRDLSSALHTYWQSCVLELSSCLNLGSIKFIFGQIRE